MTIALIGATGRVGSRILNELVSRGHKVTAIVRHPEKVAPAEGVTAIGGDINDVEGLAAHLAGHEVVISAVRFSEIGFDDFASLARRSGVPRWLIVGGAGSLFVRPGARLVHEPDFPPQFSHEATLGLEFLSYLQGLTDLDWTFLSPSQLIFAGERTGTFRLGGDELLHDASGKSHISFEDYAVALVDEVEKPAHSRRRFTVGY